MPCGARFQQFAGLRRAFRVHLRERVVQHDNSATLREQMIQHCQTERQGYSFLSALGKPRVIHQPVVAVYVDVEPLAIRKFRRHLAAGDHAEILRKAVGDVLHWFAVKLLLPGGEYLVYVLPVRQQGLLLLKGSLGFLGCGGRIPGVVLCKAL